jgi:hypothetical protein
VTTHTSELDGVRKEGVGGYGLTAEANKVHQQQLKLRKIAQNI